ncbi:MAG: hypothetical protein ACK4NC_00090 [Candidatus Gracilibacteria bacterium]
MKIQTKQIVSESVSLEDQLVREVDRNLVDGKKNIETIINDIAARLYNVSSEIESYYRNNKNSKGTKPSAIAELEKDRNILLTQLRETKNQIPVDYKKFLEDTLSSEEEIEQELADKFQHAYAKLPIHLQEKFYKQIKSSIHKLSNALDKSGLLHGALFEITRINKLTEQGLEKITTSLPPLEFTFEGIEEFLRSFSGPEQLAEKLPERQKARFLSAFSYADGGWTAHEGVSPKVLTDVFKAPPFALIIVTELLKGGYKAQRNSEVRFDVPMIREQPEKTMPYIYEIKTYGRNTLGHYPHHFNQLLKYNYAVEHDLVAGCTLEANGLIDMNFLKWATGSGIGDLGHLPHVEIIYNLKLPSGNDYRFILKKALKHRKGLRFHNDDMLYTEEDKKVIAGLQEAIYDSSILQVLFSFKDEYFSSDVKPFLNNSLGIIDNDLYNIYEKEKNKSIWEQLVKKHSNQIINLNNAHDVFSTDSSEESIGQAIENLQNFLTQNPHLTRAKEAYAIPEKDLETVLKKTVDYVHKIQDFQKKMKTVSHFPSRKEKGYTGKDEGIALDIQHIIMDVIREIKFGGLSYYDSNQFQYVQQLPEILEKRESQRKIVCEIFDPKDKRTVSKSHVTLEGMNQIILNLLRENTSRVEREIWMHINEEYLSEAEKEGLKSISFNGQKKHYTKKMQTAAKVKENYARKVQKLQTLIKNYKTLSDVLKKDHTLPLAREYEEEKEYLENKLEILTEILGNKSEYNKIAVRISKIIDQDILKFIYTVSWDETIKILEENLSENATRRPPHSVIAGGHNVFGAGEFVFKKHQKQFNDIKAWEMWNNTLTPKAWELVEINNGSGHYRPSSSTLPYVLNLMKNYKFNTKNAITNDTLTRGLVIGDISPYW